LGLARHLWKKAMTFLEACEFRLTSGQHKGRSLSDIGVTGEGLIYLDELSGRRSTSIELLSAIEVYFADPSIRAELDELSGNTNHE
jgi:hypothetical protein